MVSMLVSSAARSRMSAGVSTSSTFVAGHGGMLATSATSLCSLDDDVRPCIEPSVPAGVNHRCRIVFLNYCGTFHGRTSETLARQDGSIDPTVFRPKIAAPSAFTGGSSPPRGQAIRCFSIRGQAARNTAQANDLNNFTLGPITVDAFMLALKRFSQARKHGSKKIAAWQRQGECVVLTDVAEVGRHLDDLLGAVVAFSRQHAPSLDRELTGEDSEARDIRLGGVGIVSANKMMFDLSEQEPQCAEQPWQRRNNDFFNAELLCDIEGVHRAHAAERQHCKVAWITPALD